MIEQKGIGITLYDIVSIDKGVIAVGTGDVYYDVVFNMIVYNPFEGELIEGKVLKSLSTGIQVTLGFNDAVYIDQCYFPAGSDLFVDKHELGLTVSDEEEQLWYWDYNGTKLYLYVGAPIRFKVHHVVMKTRESMKPLAEVEVKTEENEETANQIAETQPMFVYGRINESGLGLTSWWK